MKQRVVVYAGSFDPPTNGHLWMIRQANRMFDRVIVAVGTNPKKKPHFPLEKRLQMLRELTAGMSRVSVAQFSNRFLVLFAKSVKARFLLRGIRSSSDYAFEHEMRNINGDIDSKILAVFLMPPREISEISSSTVKELVGTRGWKRIVKKYVPQQVLKELTDARVTTRNPTQMGRLVAKNGQSKQRRHTLR